MPGSDGSSLRTVQLKAKENIHVLFYTLQGHYFYQRSCVFLHVSYRLFFRT